MPLNFILAVRTLSNDVEPMFPGKAGLGIKWVTLKARTNGFTIVSNIDESDGFRVPEGGSIDIPLAELVSHLQTFNFNGVYWKNTTKDANCVVEIIGQRMVGNGL